MVISEKVGHADLFAALEPRRKTGCSEL